MSHNDSVYNAKKLICLKQSTSIRYLWYEGILLSIMAAISKFHRGLIFPFFNFAGGATWGQSYKTFYRRNLQIYTVSQSICQPSLEKLDRNKHSSLVRKFVNYGHKKFYYTGTGGQSYKTFYGRNLQIYTLSQSVCQPKMEKLAKDKHSSLVRKFVNYGHKNVLLHWHRGAML